MTIDQIEIIGCTGIIMLIYGAVLFVWDNRKWFFERMR